MLRTLILPLILTFLPVLLICHEAALWSEDRRRGAAEAWQEGARATAARWDRASKLSFWVETTAARFRESIERNLPTSSPAPIDPAFLGRIAGQEWRAILPRSLPKPAIWLYALPRRPEEAPRPCFGTGLETQFSRLIGSILHEIDRRNRFEPGRPRPTAWKQTLDRLFGFGASPELFAFSSRGRAFPVIFQGKYHLCVWDFVQNDDELTAVFLMLLPSTLGDADTARRLCFSNWQVISREQPLEPVFISYPLDAAIPKQIRVRRSSPMLKNPDIRRFIRQKASELSLRPPGSPDAATAGDIALWYASRQVYDMAGEIRLPDHEIQSIFPAGPGHLACWSTLDVTAGGVGLLIGPALGTTSVFSSFAGPTLVLTWVILWVALLIRTALSGTPPSFGIRSQLAFWFLCLASLPLITAISETGKLLGDLRGNLLREYDQELSQALQDVENEDALLTGRFAELCDRRTEGASLAVSLQTRQLENRPVDPVLNILWGDLSRLGIPIRSMALFGHGGLEWSRHDSAISPELGSSLISFLRRMAFKVLHDLSPGVGTRVQGNKPKSSTMELNKIVTADLRDLTRKDRQIAEASADSRRILKFHQFLKINGEAWFLLVLFWEQSEAFPRHIRTRISEIAAKYQVELEVTRHTSFGNASIARSGKPLRATEPGTRSTAEDRIIAIQSSRLPGFILAASRPLAPLRQRLFEETWRVLAGVFGNLLLIILSGGILAAWLTTPLRSMAAALREVAAGRLDRKLGLKRSDELGKAADTLDSMTEWLRERHAMSLFVAPQVLAAVSGEGASSRMPERRRIVALTSDIRSFTTISETRPPEEVFSALNRHFRAMTPAIKDHGGFVDRFIGDAIQAIFNDETASFADPPAVRALRAAQAMMREHRFLQRKRAEAGLFTYEIGIGLASGEAVCGILGADRVRLDYSVVGEPIKVSAELEAASREGRATRIICDSGVASAAGALEVFLPVSGHPGAFEVAESLRHGEKQSGGSEPGLPCPPQEEPLAEHHASIPGPAEETPGRAAQPFILIIIILLAAGLLFSFSRMLTRSFRERAIAREQAELRHDLRLVASTNDPALQITNHVRILLFKDLPSERARAGTAEGSIDLLRERLQKAKEVYPALSWSILRHIPERDVGRNAISLRSSEVIETSGIPFRGRTTEATALFSMIKALLTSGKTSAEAASQTSSIMSRIFPLHPEQSSAQAFESFGHFTQREMFGVNGYLMWEPIVPPGWWDEYGKLIEAAPDNRTTPARWWNEMWGGILLFLPLEAMEETASLRAMTQNMLSRGTRLALIPRVGSMSRAIGSDTFRLSLDAPNALIVRKPTNLAAYPELIAARMIPPSPRWMVILERALAGLSCLLALAALLIAMAGLPPRIAAALPRRLVPLLAAAFTLTLLPSLLSGWLAGERRIIERQARLFDETSDRLSNVLKSLDEGMGLYIGQNMASFHHLASRPEVSAHLETIVRLPDRAQKEASAQALLNAFYKKGLAAALSVGNMHILGPGGIRVFDSGKTTDTDATILRDLFGIVHSQVMRRLSPAFAASDAMDEENRRILENLKGEEIKYLLLSLLSAYDVASMMAAPVHYQNLVWGLNSHDSFRIHLPDSSGQPQYVMQVHLADDTLLHQQLRNWREAARQPGAPAFSLTRNNPRITLPFSILTMHFSPSLNRIAADAQAHLAHPVEAAADLLAGAAHMPVHTYLEHDGETDLLMTQVGSVQREYLLKARLPYSRLLDALNREAAIRRGILVFLLFLTFSMAFRTASRFLQPVRSLSHAAEEIMDERFDTRLPEDRRDEFGELALAFNAMATGVEEGRRLRVFVSDSVRTAASDESRNKAAQAGEARSAAILFAAPADFSRLLHERSPETLVPLLNRYLAVMSELIRRNGGEIDKFIGEKILAVFDAERHGDLESASRAAARTAAEMSKAMKRLEPELPLSLGIGIVAGPILAGIMGTPEVRLEYTVIGDTVNTAARLCDLAMKSGGGTVIDDTSAGALQDHSMASIGEILVKGKARHITAYRLT